MPLSPMQKSAGVKVRAESSGGRDCSGWYSAAQPKASPCHASPRACRWSAKARTSARSGIRIGMSGASSSLVESLSLAIMAMLLGVLPRR